MNSNRTAQPPVTARNRDLSASTVFCTRFTARLILRTCSADIRLPGFLGMAL